MTIMLQNNRLYTQSVTINYPEHCPLATGLLLIIYVIPGDIITCQTLQTPQWLVVAKQRPKFLLQQRMTNGMDWLGDQKL